MTEHYISTVLAFLVSVKQRRGPKTRARPITQYHAYRKLYRMPIYNGYLRIPDPQRRGGPCHCSRKWCYKQHLSVYLVAIYVIIASFYIFYASSVVLTILLLKKRSNWSRIWTRIYSFERLQVYLFLCLKQNLREEDNLSTRDNWPVPKVSSVRRFYCSTHLASRLAWKD